MTPIRHPVLMPTRLPSTAPIPAGSTNSASAEDVTPSGSYGTAPAAPTWCVGDTVSVTYEVNDLCFTTSVTRYFGIAAPPLVTVNKPADSYTSACAYTDQAAINSTYTDWLAQFSVSGGCNPSGSYGTAPAAPIWCIGDTVSVTYEVTDLCFTTSVTRYFGISAPPAVNVSKPDDSYTSSCVYADQVAINSAYTDWLAQFSVSGGCNPSGSYGTAPATPIWCIGDTVSVTYEVTDLCLPRASPATSVSQLRHWLLSTNRLTLYFCLCLCRPGRHQRRLYRLACTVQRQWRM